MVQTLFQVRVWKTLNKKIQRKKHKERKSADEDKEKKHQTNKQNGEHTIRPVALVGGVGVRPRRVYSFIVVVVKIIGVKCVYYVVEEEYEKKRGDSFVRRREARVAVTITNTRC